MAHRVREGIGNAFESVRNARMTEIGKVGGMVTVQCSSDWIGPDEKRELEDLRRRQEAEARRAKEEEAGNFVYLSFPCLCPLPPKHIHKRTQHVKVHELSKDDIDGCVQLRLMLLLKYPPRWILRVGSESERKRAKQVAWRLAFRWARAPRKRERTKLAFRRLDFCCVLRALSRLPVSGCCG